MKYTGEILLNDGWRFCLTLVSGVEKETFRDGHFAPVELPHDWQKDNPRDPDMEFGTSQGFYPRDQLGWYRRRLEAPEDWRGKAVYLIIDGCQRFYDVYMNGERVGGHRYGYVQETIRLDPHLRIGQSNVLCVRVDNTSTLGDRWYSGAGLYRDVRLLVKNEAHIRPWSLCVRETHSSERGTVTVTAEAEGCREGDLAQCVICDPTGHEAARAVSGIPEGRIAFELPVEDVRLWDIEDPALYRLSVSLTRNGETLDMVYETMGFRDAYFDGDRGFFLNGKNVKLFGANLHHDGGVVFGAALPREVLARRLRVLKSMGCNAIRCSHNPHAEFLYELCDEMGLVVIDELYDKWCRSWLYFEYLFMEDRFEDLSRMITRDRNHPSIILWSVGNELDYQYSGQFYELLGEMTQACREMDPTRPVSLALVGFCNIGEWDDETPLQIKTDLALKAADLVDVFVGNYMEGYYEALREAGLRKAIIGGEVFTYYQNDTLSAFKAVARSPWAVVKEKPYVAGGFVWAGVDYLGESMGYPLRGWPGCPVDSTAHIKLRGWYVQSQWSQKPMLRIGIFDDTAYDDHARSSWGFPLMRGDWYARREDLMLHVAVMTNCDEVRLSVNGTPARICTQADPDGMMHFLVPYEKGELKAEGFIRGEKAAEQVLHSSDGPKAVRIRVEEGEEIRHGRIVQVDLDLMDAFDQPWERTSPELCVTVEGDGKLVGVDNGDMMAENIAPASGRTNFHLGHAAAYVRITGDGGFTLKVCCGDILAEADISSDLRAQRQA